MVEFWCQELALTVRFSDEVVETLLAYRQKRFHLESGGLLFSELSENDCVNIVDVSVPSRWDFRRHDRFRVHTGHAQKLINRQFFQGLHFVGDWHSHSEVAPTPSPTDNATIRDVFNQSKHELNYLLMVIIGSTVDFSRSYVAFTDGYREYLCSHVAFPLI